MPAAAATRLPIDTPPVVQSAAAAPATPTSAPRPSLLDSEATRRAVREAARAPLLAERAASAMDTGLPQRPEDRLGQQIKNAATADCLKGEFAGAGAGLLSLPFWALAEARGKCRR